MFKMPARLLARRRQQRREVFNDTDARALAPAPDETINVEVPLRVNAELGARLLRQNKTLIVRNALDPAMVRAYGRAVKEHWSAYMNGISAISEKGKIGRFRNEHFRAVHQAAGLESYAFARALGRSPAVDVLRAYFCIQDVPATWLHLVSAIGMFAEYGPNRALPFHQDGQDGKLTVRAWVLLYPESAGDISAGLKFLPTRATATILPVEEKDPSSEHYAHLETSHRVVKSLEVEEQPWIPIIRLGDIVLFSGDCLHATYFPSTVATDRFAVQATFFSGAPEEEDGFCLFTPEGVLFPTDDTVEAWYDDPPCKINCAQSARTRRGFDLLG